MSCSLPEKQVIFKGLTGNKEDMNKLMLTPLIHYPLPGGSALITFEEAKGKCEKSTAPARCHQSFWVLCCVLSLCHSLVLPLSLPCVGLCPLHDSFAVLCPVLESTGSGSHSPVLGIVPAHSGPEDHRDEGAHSGAELWGTGGA